MRKRQLERFKNENEEQRHTRLEDIQYRTSERVKSENEEQRLTRLEKKRQRVKNTN